MRYIIRETLFRLGGSIVVLGAHVFCGLVAAIAMLIKGEEGCLEALEFNQTILR